MRILGLVTAVTLIASGLVATDVTTVQAAETPPDLSPSVVVDPVKEDSTSVPEALQVNPITELTVSITETEPYQLSVSVLPDQ